MEYGGYPDQAVSTDADFRLPESQECDRTFLSPPEDTLRNTYKVRPHSTRTVNQTGRFRRFRFATVHVHLAQACSGRTHSESLASVHYSATFIWTR